MCGIVAVLDPTGELTPELLAAMRDQIAHRGPDGYRSWFAESSSGVVGLGHRRLAIIDLNERAAQPMFNRTGELALIHNGEIYNYIELREELEAEGVVFTTTSDTEVLLAAYERWGPDCLSRLNGMFAFMIWDGRRGELFAARDRFGEKPLFLAKLPGGGIALGSEMKALLAHPRLQAVADEETIERYAAGNYYEDGERTFFRGIERVPPAHALILDGSGAVRRRWRYWTPDYEARDGYVEEDAVERFRELLAASVRMRLRSDVPVGTSLSGGLDSSMIVGLLAEMRHGSTTFTQNAFTARFDDYPELSEGEEAALVADRARLNAFTVEPHGETLADESARLHWHQEEPFLSASIYLQWCVMRLAHGEQTTVLLDGQGADELLAGYQPYFRRFQLDRLDRGQLLALVRESRAFRSRLRETRSRFPDRTRRFDPEVALSPFALAAAALRRPAPESRPYSEGLPPARRGGRLRRLIAEDLQYTSLPILLRYADRNAMAFSRETRFPFLDHELVDWCLTLPDQAFVKQGWQKYILRRAGEGLMPRRIQWRVDKVGYAAPLDRWLRGPLEGWANERLFAGPIVDVPGYDGESLRRLWSEHQAGAGDHSWALWRWISLNEWFALLEGGRWKAAAAPANAEPAPAM
jgi:asparagine synthase (glutamine-hydrolysing)